MRGRRLLSAARKAKAKVAVVTGDDDQIVPVRASKRVAHLLGVELQELPDTGHLPMDERPGSMADALLDFLSERGSE